MPGVFVTKPQKMWRRSHCIHFRDWRGFKSIMAGSAHGIGDTDLDCPPRQTNTARTADAWFSSSSHPYSTAISRCWVLGGKGDRWFSWDGSSTSSFISVGCDTFSTYWSWGSWPRGNQWAQCFCRARLDFIAIWSAFGAANDYQRWPQRRCIQQSADAFMALFPEDPVGWEGNCKDRSSIPTKTWRYSTTSGAHQGRELDFQESVVSHSLLWRKKEVMIEKKETNQLDLKILDINFQLKKC